MTLVAEIVLVITAGVAVAGCLARLPAPGRDRWRSAVPPPAPRPVQLTDLERLVSRSQASALTVHAYLRPLLVEITTRQLATRGVALDRLSESAGRDLLGDGLWDLVRPGRPLPSERHGPGIAPAQLDAMLASLEEL
jgi:hypothetical protein